MNEGRIVETLERDALLGRPDLHPYTRQLLLASRGYDRRTAAELVRFD
jgi:ABC-type oligopeptide transport system ATPase subunit